MNRKVLLLVAGGVCAAGLLCFIVGLIVYFTNRGNAIPVIISLFTMATGVIIAAVAAVVLIAALIVAL
ncbi:MAG: hypothetical protein K2N50_00520, partial [Clostridia bacterium]|nr:hypothetical protein [Clostridia bacterium]